METLRTRDIIGALREAREGTLRPKQREELAEALHVRAARLRAVHGETRVHIDKTLTLPLDELATRFYTDEEGKLEPEKALELAQALDNEARKILIVQADTALKVHELKVFDPEDGEVLDGESPEVPEGDAGESAPSAGGGEGGSEGGQGSAAA